MFPLSRTFLETAVTGHHLLGFGTREAVCAAGYNLPMWTLNKTITGLETAPLLCFSTKFPCCKNIPTASEKGILPLWAGYSYGKLCLFTYLDSYYRKYCCKQFQHPCRACFALTLQSKKTNIIPTYQPEHSNTLDHFLGLDHHLVCHCSFDLNKFMVR